MKRRVGAGTSGSRGQNIYEDEEDVEAVPDLGAPVPDFAQLDENQLPRFQDVRQNEYLANMKRIGQLPLAMSEDDAVRGDAMQNFNEMGGEGPLAVDYEGPLQAYGNDPNAQREMDWVTGLGQLPNAIAGPEENAMQENPQWLNEVHRRLQTPGKQAEKTMMREGQPEETPEFIRNLEKSAQAPNRFAAESMIRKDLQEGPEVPDWLNALGQMAQTPGKNAAKTMMARDAEEQQKNPAQNEIQVAENELPRSEGNRLQDPLETIRQRIKEEPSLMEGLPEETRRRLEETPEDVNRPFAQNEGKGVSARIVPPEEPITAEMVETAKPESLNPDVTAQALENPIISEDLKRLNDLQEIPKEDQEGAIRWRTLIQKKRDELTAEETSLLQQAEEGSLSTGDKIALGIALAVPILVALRFGGEAGLVALGGGLQGYGNALQAQQKNRAQSKEKLKENADERLKLEEKNIDVSKKQIDAIPNKEAREFLKNKKFAKIGDKAGIKIGDERNALWLDGSQFNESSDGVKKAREDIKEAEDLTALMSKSDNVIEGIMSVLDAMPQDAGVWDAIKANKGWFTSAGGKSPFGKPLMIKVKDQKTGKTRDANVFELLKQKTTQLQDVYNKLNLQRAVLTGNVIEHWESMLGDPKDLSEWLTGRDLQALKDKTTSLQSFLNMAGKERMVSKGFLREPLDTVYPSEDLQPIENEENVIEDLRRNPDAFRNKAK